MDGLEIVLGEQMEGAEELVIFEVEGAGSLKVATEGKQGGRLYDEFLWGPNLAELFVVVGSGDPGSSPRSAAMVGVVVVGVKV